MSKPVYKASEKLGMLDEHGHRKFIIPAEARGVLTSLKKKIHFVLLVIFLALPWLQINGNQALHFDIPGRQFFVFGFHFFSYDAPLIFFILIGLAVGLALVTALFGRVWCGWACPQTVFIESVYRQIERWVEGNYIARRKLQAEGISFQKVWKQSLKWSLYFIVSSLIAHSFVAYWTGSEKLLSMVSGSPSENSVYFLLISAMTALLLFNFGWFREQFCVIVCPYGRFQSVLMDSHSVTVMYDEKRGEPRKAVGVPADQRGDCVSCNRCVEVCPTGIDIRNGIQMECISCAACIDACDEIMTKVNKPKGLIRYKHLREGKVKWFRGRVVGYGAVVFASFVLLTILLIFHQPVRVEFLRSKAIPYQVTDDGKVRNQFILKLENHQSQAALLKLESPQNIKLILPQNPVPVAKDGKQEIPVFIEIDRSQFIKGSLSIDLQVLDSNSGKIFFKRQISLVGPLG